MTNDSKYDILGDVLPAIDPASLNYQEWVDVGMALKDGGFTADDWDAWSRRDTARYHKGECVKKWATLKGSGITLGTLVQYARRQGWTPPRHYSKDVPYDWDGVIGGHDSLSVVDSPEALEQHPLPAVFPDWEPARELARYLELLFAGDEVVGYVTSVWYSKDKDKYMPDRGVYTRTAGELIAALNTCGGDLGAVVGDVKPEAGAWIRFNPLSGNGVRNDDVTDYRYALVESDAMPVEQQYALYRAMELPCRVMVHSGGKSLHAIVHIGAGSYAEYRERVAYLYKVCEANGLKVDGQNKNPSRLSRMPGVLRNGQRQYLVAENTGKASFEEWREYIEGMNDDLPDPENLADVWDNLPPLAPPLIDGVLRQGHKLLLAGPSKAGKSFALMELAVAIAEGRDWLGFPCAQGRVLYVNLEVDKSSCWHRLRGVYEALGVPPEHRNNIDVWNLRGSAVPMDRLAPKLIRRAQKRDYLAIIIDPIYKVITGDENSADQMAKFCNQFDLIATRLGCAVIYCHHHSKGAQGGKRSMDRASGSGVFARDPDALLDMIELPVADALRKQQENRLLIDACVAALEAAWMEPTQCCTQDDLCSAPRMLDICDKVLPEPARIALAEKVAGLRKRAGQLTAWRIEGTLREFPRFPPVNLWFDYPAHRADDSGALGDIQPEVEVAERMLRGRKKLAENNQNLWDRVLADIRNAVDFSATGSVAVRDLKIVNKMGNPYSADKINEWFGNGQNAKEAFKQQFETYVGPDGSNYLRRRDVDA